MKKLFVFAAVAVSSVLFSFKAFAPTTWAVDKMHAKLAFSITHMGISDVEGQFKTFDATINAPGDDFTNAQIELTADANSFDTDNDARDKHVKSDAFLDVAKYPTISFKSTGVKKTGANTYVIAGNLTMHGVTKPVSLNATVRTGVGMNKKPVAGFKITGTINRTDFGVGSGFGSAVLSNEVTIAANGEFGQK